MYKQILPVIMLLGTTTAIAQPSLNAANIGPVLKDSFVTQICDTTGITQGLAGANITWHFETVLLPSTTLTPDKDTGFVVNASTANGYSSLSTLAGLFGSATAFNASNAATATPSNTATTYYQATSAKISQTGVYINIGNQAVYTDPLDQIRFPFTMGSTYTDTYAGGLAYTVGTSTISATESGTATVTADAYGTLVIPGTTGPVTYTNVLRVHTTQNFRDSANLFGTPSVTTFTLHSYTWYSAGYHSPLLTVSTATGGGIITKTVSYALRQLANHAAVSNVNGIDASLVVYPNPASGNVYITFNNQAKETIRTSILDMTGREIEVIDNSTMQGINTISYNTAALAKGNYLVRLQSAGETITRKISVQ